MKIRNGKIKIGDYNYEKETRLRSKLEVALNSWFSLNLTDVPEIMKKIGVRSENYEILLSECDTAFDTVNLLVKTKHTSYEVEIFRGNMVNPYSHFKISNNGKTKIYTAKKVIQVELCEE